MTTIDLIEKPDYPVHAALYFVEGGHYLFRRFNASEGEIAKFVRSTDVAAAFLGQDIDTGWMPAGVTRCGNNARGSWFVYSAPGQKMDITLSSDEYPVKIPIPRTVLVGIGSLFYIWAIRGVQFDIRADLYHAPFPNVYKDGKICWGQNAAPEVKAENARTIWEKFFKTPFNGDLAQGKSLADESDVRLLLRRLAETRTASYPQDELIRVTNGRVDSMIEKLLRG